MPFPLRFLFATEPAALTAVLGIDAGNRVIVTPVLVVTYWAIFGPTNS